MGKINDPKIFPTDSSIPYTTTASPNIPGTSATSTPMSPGAVTSPTGQLSGREWLGKGSGFPESFESDIKNLYRQMFRCYAHIYHGHWLEPFYHISAYKELNTCFIHFINVGKLFDLLSDKDVKPMQPLIDIWQSKDLLPVAKAPTAEPTNVSG